MGVLGGKKFLFFGKSCAPTKWMIPTETPNVGLGLYQFLKPEAFVQRFSVKKVFLKISQNSQENTCARVFFNKVAGLGLQVY